MSTGGRTHVYILIIPNTCKCEIKTNFRNITVTITGPNATMVETLPNTNNTFTRNRIEKMIIGAAAGFKQYLRIRGVGYSLKSGSMNELAITAGFSYTVNHRMHPSISLNSSRKASNLRVRSKYANTITQELAYIRKLRQADVYRGLGIYRRYEPILFKKSSKTK